MSTTTLYLLALIVGIIAGVYLPLNGRFSEQLGSPLLATSIFFLVGAATAVIAWTIAGQGGLAACLKPMDTCLAWVRSASGSSCARRC